MSVMSSLNLVRLTSNTEKKKKKKKEKKDIQGTPHSTWGKFFLPQSVTQEVFHMYLYIYIYTNSYFRWIKINKT